MEMMLLGELKAFRHQTEKDLSEIKKDIKSLQQFKWRVAGGAAVLSVLLAAVIELIKK